MVMQLNPLITPLKTKLFAYRNNPTGAGTMAYATQASSRLHPLESASKATTKFYNWFIEEQTRRGNALVQMNSPRLNTDKHVPVRRPHYAASSVSNKRSVLSIKNFVSLSLLGQAR